MANENKVCSDCIHFHACQSWAFGILGNTDAELCKYYETIVDSNAYYLGQVDADKRNKPMKLNTNIDCCSGKVFVCPVCGFPVSFILDIQYCQKCGQRLEKEG